jgi:hypothetical protein
MRPVAAADLGAAHGVEAFTDAWPIQVVGSGATVNDATQNAFDRTAALFDITEGEVRARCTFTGGVQIGRLPGVVQLDMLVPAAMLAPGGWPTSSPPITRGRRGRSRRQRPSPVCSETNRVTEEDVYRTHFDDGRPPRQSGHHPHGSTG